MLCVALGATWSYGASQLLHHLWLPPQSFASTQACNHVHRPRWLWAEVGLDDVERPRDARAVAAVWRCRLDGFIAPTTMRDCGDSRLAPIRDVATAAARSRGTQTATTVSRERHRSSLLAAGIFISRRGGPIGGSGVWLAALAATVRNGDLNPHHRRASDIVSIGGHAVDGSDPPALCDIGDISFKNRGAHLLSIVL